nr:hypothetical protein [Sulfitobacter mediterraneus]
MQNAEFSLWQGKGQAGRAGFEMIHAVSDHGDGHPDTSIYEHPPHMGRCDQKPL